MIEALTVITFFISMEGVAWFTHKYIMHGLLWSLHKDHHKREYEGFLEKNDFFFLFFAIPGIVCLILGLPEFTPVFFAGVGITLYGFTYFIIHDILVHQRIRYFRNTNNKYLLALRRAHKIHHKHLGKEEGECFGLLLFPSRFFENHPQASKENS
jgi:beta-carotene 3-hydroxylase